MGGTAGYARPVEPTDGRISTWRAHTNRGVPSSEPGVDYFCPIGTPIRSAAAGRVVDVGTSINPATGRFITVDLDDGRRVRYLHILRHLVGVGARVKWGQHIADSGATGYGEQDWSWNVAGTGGAHVHMTLWAHQEYNFGRYATLDPELYMTSNQGGSNASPTPAAEQEEEDEDMPKNSGVWYRKDKSTYVYLVFNTGSGFAHEFSNGTNRGTMPGKYTAGLKVAMDIAGWSEVTLGHANVIKSALVTVRPKDAPREIEVTVVSQDELDALES